MVITLLMQLIFVYSLSFIFAFQVANFQLSAASLVICFSQALCSLGNCWRCRLPTPRHGEVLGLVGTNGIGKSTALKVLAGKLKPNLGRYASAPDWKEIIEHFRGSELQNFFTRLVEDNLKPLIKPQYVDQIALDPKLQVLVNLYVLGLYSTSTST